MPQLIRCPNATCGTAMRVPDDAAGKKVQCPKCHQAFLVGAPAREPVGAAAPAAARAPAARPSAPPASSVRPPTPSVPTPAPPTASPTECPACKSALLPGAIACMDCGYLVQAEPSPGEMEGAPNLCPNPACGVANPP